MNQDAKQYGGSGAGRAVVIGSSLAGLLAAWVLAQRRNVTVVERDAPAEGPEFRPGVPQARHAHAFMEGGQQALEALLPGILDELTDAGATRVRLPTELGWLDSAGWNTPGNPGRVTFLTCTRPLLTWTVRQRVATHPRITFRENTVVTGLLHEDGAVRGVLTRSRDGGGSRGTDELQADLVIDASGRGSRAPEWLTGLGYPAPEEEVVDPGIGYATRLFRRTPRATTQKFKAMAVQAMVERPTMGLLVPVENDCWLVALGGTRGHEAPTDPDAWLEFARNLRSPLIHDLISDAVPVTPIFGYRNTQNRRRHYERCARRPEGFAVLGDAACTFNPIYGHGMSVACKEALALRELVARRGTGSGFAAAAARMVARTVSTPWAMATSEDRRYPTTVCARKPGLADRLLSWYVDRLNAESLVNPKAGANFFAVLSLAEPPTRFFRPSMVWAALRRPRSRHGAAPPPVLAPPPARPSAAQPSATGPVPGQATTGRATTGQAVSGEPAGQSTALKS